MIGIQIWSLFDKRIACLDWVRHDATLEHVRFGYKVTMRHWMIQLLKIFCTFLSHSKAKGMSIMFICVYKHKSE